MQQNHLKYQLIFLPKTQLFIFSMTFPSRPPLKKKKKNYYFCDYFVDSNAEAKNFLI